MYKEKSERQIILEGAWNLQNIDTQSSRQTESVAEFRTSFTLNDKWLDNGDILLRLEVLASGIEVSVNDVKCRDLRPGLSFLSITELLKKGNNEIVLNLNGMVSSRPVRLRSISLLHMPVGGFSNISVYSYFDSSWNDAFINFKASLDCRGITEGTTYVIAWRLYDTKGEILASSPLMQAEFKEGQNAEVENELRVVEPLHWNAEEPNLYKLVMTVSNKDGYLIDVRVIDWGFRNYIIYPNSQGNILTLNGNPIKLWGPDIINFDYSTPYQEWEDTLCRMKQKNINAIIAPPFTADEILQLADKLGLYVIREYEGDNESTSDGVHPSILAWLTRNKTDRNEFNNHLFASTSFSCKTADIFVQDSKSMFWAWLILKKRGLTAKSKWKKPVLFRGFSGNVDSLLSNASQMDQSTKFAGLFLGSLTDWSGETFQKKYTPISVVEDTILDGHIFIENRCVFINLRNLELHWSIQRNGEIVAEGLIRQPDIAPRTRKRMHIYRDLSAFPGKGEGFLNIAFLQIEDTPWSEAGSQFMFCQFPVPELKESPKENSLPKNTQIQDTDIQWRWKNQNSDLLAATPNTGIRLNLTLGTIEVLDLGLGNILAGSGIFPINLNYLQKTVDYHPLVYTGYRFSKGNQHLVLSYKVPGKGFFHRFRVVLTPSIEGGIDVKIKPHTYNRRGLIALRMEMNSLYYQIEWYGNHTDSASSYSIRVQDSLYKALAPEVPESPVMRTGVRWIDFSDGHDVLHIKGRNNLLRFFVTSESGEESDGEALVICIHGDRNGSGWQMGIQRGDE